MYVSQNVQHNLKKQKNIHRHKIRCKYQSNSTTEQKNQSFIWLFLRKNVILHLKLEYNGNMYKTRSIPTLTGEAAEHFAEWQKSASIEAPTFDVKETLNDLRTILSRSQQA